MAQEEKESHWMMKKTTTPMDTKGVMRERKKVVFERSSDLLKADPKYSDLFNAVERRLRKDL